MARFYGVVGYGHSVEKPDRPGVWVMQMIERSYKGDVKRIARTLRDGEHLHGDISISNEIEILADAYAFDNFLAIKYIKWSGQLWTVAEVSVERPRLLLRLGGVYNGAVAQSSPTP